MAERFRCPPHIVPRTTASLLGVLESTPTCDGSNAYRAELGVGDDTYALAARGATGRQLACGRPGDCLLVGGTIKLHDNVVAGKKQKLITIEVESVTIEWTAPRGVRAL